MKSSVYEASFWVDGKQHPFRMVTAKQFIRMLRKAKTFVACGPAASHTVRNKIIDVA